MRQEGIQTCVRFHVLKIWKNIWYAAVSAYLFAILTTLWYTPITLSNYVSAVLPLATGLLSLYEIYDSVRVIWRIKRHNQLTYYKIGYQDKSNQQQ